MKVDLEKLLELESAATPAPWTELGTLIRREDGAWIMSAVINAKASPNMQLVAAMRNNIKVLIECVRALEWYANKDHYDYCDPLNEDGETDYIYDDHGRLAREALAKLGGEG